MKYQYGTLVDRYRHGNTEVLGEKPVPLPLCPQKISHELAWDRNRAFATRGWRQTVWAMAQPIDYPCPRITSFVSCGRV